MHQRRFIKRVLIAHQSTIPHYRVPFYNALETLRPSAWRFDVVFDPSEVTTPSFFKEPLDVSQFKFPVTGVKSWSWKLFNRAISYQTFWRRAAGYDLVIVENAVNNLTYPLCALHQLHGTKVAYWGHGKDRSVESRSIAKVASELFKLWLTRRADGFFAYTQGVRAYLEAHGISPHRIFVVNNTIDILEQRRAFEKLLPERTAIRRRLGVENKKVLLFIGRFTKNKRIDFLLRSFSILCEMDPGFHLLLVGSAGQLWLSYYLSVDKADSVSYFGPIVELDKLAPVYIASDLFVFPGSVGLGPLQALCYDLPVITIDSPTHMPEIEYLSPTNAIVLARATTPEEYAQAIVHLFNDRARISALKAGSWPSIRHLTVEQMAHNFIAGVNRILDS